MFGDPHGDRRQIEHLATFHANQWRIDQSTATSAATHRFVTNDLIRHRDLRQRRPRMREPPPGLRPPSPRNDFGPGLTNGESDDGGFEEFDEFCPNRRFNSATSERNCVITAT
ncbi:hypothetical protein Acsp05_72590 [Actinokineospora sp. NBRC 105648]|nr:hypothetical protein Acsp05_72590 [Actinokineospora sp. NBRC 105648]